MPQHDNAVLICMPFGKATWIDRFYEETVKPVISEFANSVRIDYPVADLLCSLSGHYPGPGGDSSGFPGVVSERVFMVNSP